MSNPASDLIRHGIKTQRERIGSPVFTFLGVTYPCVPSTERRGTIIDWGGRLIEIQLSIVVDKSKLTKSARPLDNGLTITMEGKEYVVVKVGTSATQSHYVFDLADPTKR